MIQDRRGGYTLVEMLVVISVNSALMAVALALIGLLLKAERQGQRHFERVGTVTRLAQQFREDVASARSATLDHDRTDGAAVSPVPFLLKLQGSGERTVGYWRDGERLRRVEYQTSQVTGREAYFLAELADAEFLVDGQNVAVRLAFSDERNCPREGWRIESMLAKDWRFDTEPQP